ncbi:MAG: cytochrome c family protein, partial [Rhodospirillaceae bacterium]
MSSLEINKVAGSVLLAVLAMVVIGKIGDNLVSVGDGHGGGHGGERTASASAPAPKVEEPLEPIVGMLASADPAAGERVFAKCRSCHTVDKGGRNGIGPNLWGVVGASPGTHEGFSYSPAITSMSDGQWTYARLNAFVHKPREFAEGTKMVFAGLPRTADRANVVAYLRTLSDSPAPLPTD